MSLARALSLAPLPPSLAPIASRLAERQAKEAEPGRQLWAAVAVVLVPDPNAVLLIRRAERAGDPWSGQVGFPGGRQGPGDRELVDTAIRETAEEVGLGLETAARLGALDDVVPRTPVLPPIAVRPFVFAFDARLTRPRLRLNPEVAAAHWVELARLREPASYGTANVTVHGESRVVPAYLLDGLVIWGMTERILFCLLQTIY